MGFHNNTCQKNVKCKGIKNSNDIIPEITMRNPAVNPSSKNPRRSKVNNLNLEYFNI